MRLIIAAELQYSHQHTAVHCASLLSSPLFKATPPLSSLSQLPVSPFISITPNILTLRSPALSPHEVYSSTSLAILLQKNAQKWPHTAACALLVSCLHSPTH